MRLPGRARIRARSLAILAGAVLTTAVAGCSAAGSSSVKVSGKTLTIYASVPAGADQAARDVYYAEQLAFDQKHSEVTAFKPLFKRVTASKLSDNARTAIEDNNAIAYLGEIVPGSSADTLGITNAQDLLQVSPTDTALELTQATAAVPGAPSRYYESLKTYGRTFARVVPTTAQEAKAQVQEMQALGVRQLFVADDGSPYGRAIAAAVKQDGSPAISAASSQTGADALFYGAGNVSSAIREFNSAAQTNPKIKLFGPSALDTNALVSGLAAGVHNVFISAPGFLSSNLPASGQTFVTDFTARYGHAPSPEAIFGYAAMSGVLDAIKKAGASANNRATVVQAFFPIQNRDSVLGTYSINAKGDTSLAQFVFSRLRAGTLTAFKQVQAQG